MGFVIINNNLNEDSNVVSCDRTREDEVYKMVIPTDNGVIICKFYCEGKVVDITLDEISNSNSAFDFIIESYGNRSLISIDEDGEVIENELCMSFSMECFYNISSESELAELLEEGNIDEDVYEDIERVGVLLA